MGGPNRRHWASSRIAELASVTRRMLWCLDSRRPLLLLPEFDTRRVRSLGHARISRHHSKTVFYSLPTDYGPLSVGPLAPSPDGKKLFVAGRQSRGELVRY